MKVETNFTSENTTRLNKNIVNLNCNANELGAFALFPTLFGIIHGINCCDSFESSLHPDVKNVKAYAVGKGIGMGLKVIGVMFLLKLCGAVYKKLNKS